MQTRSPQDNQTSRLLSLDGLRGLIMVLMALDHANHFLAQKHSPGEYWGGPFPVYQDVLPFLTRLVTHLAAPGFFFLMGTAMTLFADSRRRQGWSRWEIARHFLIRGALLVALQLLVVNRAWEWSPGGWGVQLYVGVLYALGGTMILGSMFMSLGTRWLLALSALLFLGTEFLAPAPELWGKLVFEKLADQLNLWLIYPGGTLELWSNYPLLPWLELVVLGMAFGQWLLADVRQAYTRALRLGLLFILAFIIVRWLDGFGNIRPRSGSDWMAFLNPVKYPPSMTFTLMTMGVNLLLLGLFGRAGARVGRLLKGLTTYGRVPLFFYVAHLFLYAGMGWLLTPGGTSIPRMYPYWIVGLILLYPLCHWYGRFKSSRPASSIWHFF
jgi:uncharacterized membrane protein